MEKHGVCVNSFCFEIKLHSTMKTSLIFFGIFFICLAKDGEFIDRRLNGKTNSVTPNNTYLNNFEIFKKVFKKEFKMKNIKIKNLIVTLFSKKGLFYYYNQLTETR